ncbi:uncharacterized protein VP01_5720g1 [Puccinia sorghi]|uniref:Retrotransposon gag domain-containing protein n=1 Tax=Puccinia sorghi TaxID=27349 RepID=A0A0L6UIK3_9BASI|nr:uncharacterized protein VP01_5720g1 [Puccinia sorghi]
MDQIPNSLQTPQIDQSLPTQQATLPSDSNHSAGNEGWATSPARDVDPTQLFLNLLQTLKQPSSSGPKFPITGMKPPDKFDGENSSNLRGFLQSYDRKKVLYAASYLGGRASMLNSLSMKENSKAPTYISQFRTLQSKIDWNNDAFAFLFQKGLPSRITNQLALTGQRLKTLQKLINQTIELDNCHHNKIRSSKKADSTPSTLKNEDALKYKKKLPSNPSTPSALTLAPSQDNSIRRNKREGRGKEFVCIVLQNWQNNRM